MRKIGRESEASSFEELGPEQTVQRRSARWLEVLLGLGLLLIVAGLAGGDWWQGESQHAAFRAGDQAAAAHRWDEAHTWFLAAGNYPTAKSRAAAAAATIAERDKQYEQALTALAKGDGVGTLQALDAVDKIEAGYGGSSLLRSEADLQVYRSALEGIVAMRRAASPAGLYYRTADDWAWLVGSDALSSLRNYGNADYVVYDVPAAGAAPGGAAATLPPAGAGSPPQSRRLMAARVGSGALLFTPVALDARASVFWGTQGGWSYEYGCSASTPPQVRSYYCADGMIYSAAGSAITTTVKLPSPKWIVADLARDGSKMLVADISAQNSAVPRSRLYLAAPDGSHLRLLYEDPSWIERATFSQDGRYVLATLGFVAGAEGTSYKVVLLDAAGTSAPQILSTVHDANLETPAGMDFVLLSGAGPGKVVIAQYSKGQTVLQLVDLSSSQKQARTLWVSRQFREPMMVTRTGDGGILVCGWIAQVSLTLDPLNTSIGKCVLLDGALHDTTFDLPVIARYGIGFTWPRQGSIIYPIAVPQGGAAGLSILRITASQAQQAPPSPIVILQLPLGAGEALNVVAGQSMLAYARQGQLHVRTYDGSTDLLLEEGVDTLYDVRGAADITMLF